MYQRHARLSAFDGIFRYQDGGLCQQSDEHNQTGLHIDVILQSHQLGKQETAQQAERKGEHHGKRDEETFIKCAQDEIDQHKANGEDNHRVAARLTFLAGDAAKLVGIAFGQCRGRRFADGTDGVAGRIAVGSRTVDRNGAIEVEAVERLWPVGLGKPGKLADGSHFTVAGTHIEVVQRFRCDPCVRLRLYHDTVELGETVKIGDILPAIVTGHRGKHLCRRKPRTFATGGINVQRILRIVC